MTFKIQDNDLENQVNPTPPYTGHVPIYSDYAYSIMLTLHPLNPIVLTHLLC